MKVTRIKKKKLMGLFFRHSVAEDSLLVEGAEGLVAALAVVSFSVEQAELPGLSCRLGLFAAPGT
jgi:hypothetical protein